MSRLDNDQRYGPATPPGKLLFPVGERPNPARPVIRVGAAVWRQRGLWKWIHWPPDFEVGTEMGGRVQATDGTYRLYFPGVRLMEEREFGQHDLKRARSVANALGMRMDRNGYCFPSLEVIAAETSFKDDNIPGLYRILEDLGFLHVHQGGGRQANRYWATLPKPLAEPRDR